MIANIYGRHPSIEQATPGPCDVSFGINTTPMDCDWLVFGDLRMIHLIAHGEWKPRHRIGVVGPASFQFLHDNPPLGVYKTWREMGRPFRIYKSGVMSLLAALRFGATEVHTYGMRREGMLHAGGGPPERVGELRWVKEQSAHNRMVAFLAANGTTVTEH